jgi:hypothetical protein
VECRGGGLTLSGVSRNRGSFVKCVAIQKRLGIPALNGSRQWVTRYSLVITLLSLPLTGSFSSFIRCVDVLYSIFASSQHSICKLNWLDTWSMFPNKMLLKYNCSYIIVNKLAGTFVSPRCSVAPDTFYGECTGRAVITYISHISHRMMTFKKKKIGGGSWSAEDM